MGTQVLCTLYLIMPGVHTTDAVPGVVARIVGGWIEGTWEGVGRLRERDLHLCYMAHAAPPTFTFSPEGDFVQ